MLSLIACCDKSMAIGYENNLLYHIPEDMKRFKELTTGKLCIQGRLTYESIVNITGKPLQNRRNIILTKNKDFKPDHSSFVYHSIDDVLKLIRVQLDTDEEVMVIGGGAIYEAFLPHADKVYLTIVDSVAEKADSYFPRLNDDWRVIEKDHRKAITSKGQDYSFITYENFRKA
ncbi:dihydrofolate reductase [Bacillus velezensis]|uniref:dihydrofolate reductase n=1 Tax=Bacillus velezensis TaxID=492670 RepID=UPI002DB66396|nr:dihydrofolate reductase [Bacillus velezensis]MEC2354089.1 dihydrofolate reductase [Bacillus velezensis]